MNSGFPWLLAAAFAVSVQASPITYTLTDLGTLGNNSSANAVNASGQTAVTLSTVYGYERAYAGTTNITPTGASDAMAQDINVFGQVTGTTYLNGTPYATLWTNATASYLTAGSYGMSLNDAGQVTGMTGAGHAFVTTGGNMTDLGTLTGGGWSSGYAINSSGQVAGYGDTASGAFRAFVWTGGQGVQQFGTLGGANSYAFGINAAGTVAGSAQVASGYLHAFVTTTAGLLDLGTLGGASSYGYGINAAGAVVGYSSVGDGANHAFLQRRNLVRPQRAGWRFRLDAEVGVRHQRRWTDCRERTVQRRRACVTADAAGVPAGDSRTAGGGKCSA